MSWIKIDSATPRKPEILRLARLLSVSPDAALGMMVRFWLWCDGVTVDGSVDAVVGADVDAVVGVDGFANALQSVLWLEIDPETERINVPGFVRHNGDSTKKRLEKSQRQAVWRHKRDIPVDAVVGADVDADVSTSASTREEKRIEEKNIEELLLTPAQTTADACPQADGAVKPKPKPKRKRSRIEYCDAFERWWKAYPRPESKGKANEAWIAAGRLLLARFGGDKQKAAEFLQGKVEQYAASETVRTTPQDKIPHPATWLNGGRYDDDPKVWQIARSGGSTQSLFSPPAKTNGEQFREFLERTIKPLEQHDQ